jgi:hypothetical protein
MMLDEAVVWLNDRCGKGVAVWISADDEHVVVWAEGELRHGRDASGAPLGEEGVYDVDPVRIFFQDGNVGLIEYKDHVNVFMTDRPQIALWPNDDPHLVVVLHEVGELHIAEQEQVARWQES